MCKVPNLKSLNVGAMLEIMRDNASINEFLPKFNYQKIQIGNGCAMFSILYLARDSTEFNQPKQNERTESIMEKRQVKIRALPEFIKLFKDSKSTSTQNDKLIF